MPVPDIDRTDLFVCIGANPLASNGSLMTAPDIRERLRAIRERGRVVVVDPRRTETAERADQHLFIRPGTDAVLLLAMVHVAFADNLVRLGRLAVTGLDALRTAALAWTPERAQAITTHCDGTCDPACAHCTATHEEVEAAWSWLSSNWREVRAWRRRRPVEAGSPARGGER